ncbi:MAG TPA: hypothetical protein VD905_17380 [Flavobacteriales bacterium]|nr:hypothetical protein [Flavobacteriales bacterium]
MAPVFCTGPSPGSAVNTSLQGLDYLNEKPRKIVKQKVNAVIRDGMDISFCVFDPLNLKI